MPEELELQLPSGASRTDKTNELQLKQVRRRIESMPAFDLPVRLQGFITLLEDARDALERHKEHLIVQFDPDRDDIKDLKGATVVEVAWSENVGALIREITEANPNVIVSVRLLLDENAVERAVALADEGPGIIHLQTRHNGKGFGKRSDDFVIKLVRDIHSALLENSLRDRCGRSQCRGSSHCETRPEPECRV